MKKILVIDDDPALVRSIKVVLESEGYKITTACDGVEGLDLFGKDKFDLVITDMMMPNKDGMKTISHIRKTDKEIPILAISGAGETGAFNNLSVAMMVGANATLGKPFQRKALLGAILDCFHPAFQD